MWGFRFQITTIAIATYVCACGASPLDPRYGLTFSPTTISASRYNASALLETTAFPVGRAYRQHYDNTLRSVYNTPVDSNLEHREAYAKTDQDVIMMIREEVAKVTDGLIERRGREPEYAAVFLPPIFDFQFLTAAREAVIPDGGGLDGVIDSGTSLRVACEAFGFLEGNQIGRTQEERNDEDGPQTMVLALEYEHDYLHAEVREIIWESERFPIVSKRTCLDCGERVREHPGRQDYIQRVEAFLRDFIGKTLSLYHSLDRSDIRVIVLTGESDPSAFNELGTIALKAVGTSAVKLATGINPSNAVAQGVATFIRRAHRYRGTKLDAVNFDPYKESYAENTHMGLKYHHDEL